MKWIGLIMMLAVPFGGQSAQDDAFLKFEQEESARRTCRANLMTYANAAMAYRVKSRHEGFTSDLPDLDKIIGAAPVCPAGGRYSIVAGVPEKSFTIHCSILRHDAGRVQPPGYSPRLNSDGDEFSIATIWDSEKPSRARCRARMVWISQVQIDYLLDNGKFASDLKLLEKVIGPQKCPKDGTYSVVVGKPTHAFTLHCSIQEHDAGTVEPRGYSPGRNSQ
jgi:hypothetical protein